ncbi:MAG: hypothetical protein LUC90_06290 [Lachnospiraceae bacterium]|nr:hypothetical protein [Lachnospiraceae bacterium]
MGQRLEEIDPQGALEIEVSHTGISLEDYHTVRYAVRATSRPSTRRTGRVPA